MLIMLSNHHRSGTVRRTLEVYDDFEIAQMDAIARMQADSSIEEIDVERIDSLQRAPKGITITRAESQRSMFHATKND